MGGGERSGLILLLLIAGILLGCATWQSWWQWQSTSWPQVAARCCIPTSPGATASPADRVLGLTFHYQVGDETYVGRRPVYGQVCYVEADLIGEMLLAGFANQAIDISYDPDHPQRSVAVPGFTWSPLVLACGGVLSASLAWLMTRRRHWR